MENTKVQLFKKQIQGKNGVKFYTYFIKFEDNDICIKAKLTKSFNEKVEKLQLQYPLEIEVSNDGNCYFASTEKYVDNNIEKISNVVVFKDFVNARHLEIKAKTLNDLKAMLSK